MGIVTDSVKDFIVNSGFTFFRGDVFCETASEELQVDKDAVQKYLDKLVAEGFLVIQNNKYVRSEQVGLFAGELHVKPQGFGFVLIGADKPDIYVSRENMNNALHGDRVLVKMIEKGKNKKPEGSIAEILTRGIKNVVGTVIKGKGGSFIVPDDERLGQTLDVESIIHLGQTVMEEAISGQKVVARFDGNLKSGRVHVTEILGSPVKVGIDILSIIRAHNLYEEFPHEVLTETKKVVRQPSEKEISKRVDLCNKVLITIDPEDAKDLDDAVSLVKKKDGTFELGVHIADVSHYIAEGGELDKEAFKRGTSVYFPNMVLPMLPRDLSNDICSLNPSVPRLALSVFMTIDRNGHISDHRIVESIIKVHTRFCYAEVQAILDGDKEKCKTHKETVAIIKNMAELTVLLENIRRKRGEVILDVPEPKIVLDPQTGKISDVIAYPHLLSHRIIESFMILCNEVVAGKMCELEMPFVYRIHEKPDPVKVSRFVDVLKPFAVEHKITPEHVTGHQYQKMIGGLEAGIRPIICSLALRSMQKAKYAPECVGHFGLGAKHYTHFTSPIRRYPDLIVHRIIKLMINRKLSSHKIGELHEFVSEASIQSSKTELAAKEAEREVDDLKRAEYMSERLGEKFTGHISGIADFGAFVYLPNTVEGLIKIENMPDDNYNFNERQMVLVGRKRSYKMGDQIDVTVAGVNMARRQVEFAAVRN